MLLNNKYFVLIKLLPLKKEEVNIFNVNQPDYTRKASDSLK
jgi:hypothetical protein